MFTNTIPRFSGQVGSTKSDQSIVISGLSDCPKIEEQNGGEQNIGDVATDLYTKSSQAGNMSIPGIELVYKSIAMKSGARDCLQFISEIEGSNSVSNNLYTNSLHHATLDSMLSMSTRGTRFLGE